MKPAYDSFDAYAADHPEAERYREWLTARGAGGWAFVRADEASNCFPGGYLRLAVFPLHERIPVGEVTAADRANTSRKAQPMRVAGWRVYLADSDDGETYADFPPEQEATARQLFADVKTSAPFVLHDARTVFFDWPTGRNKPKQRR